MNGKKVGTDHYEMKLAWIRRLIDHIKNTYEPGQKLALCGDFNIAPEAGDVHDPDAWEGSVLYNDAMRAYFEELIEWGFVDTFRQHEKEPGHFSWWDYRMLAFPKNKGLRIDFVLATPSLAETCTAAGIDRDQRRPKGGPEGTKPSDHAPVWAEFSD